MKRKNTLIFYLQFLIPFATIAILIIERNRELRFLIPGFLVLAWSLSLLWTSWKHYISCYPPKLNADEREMETPDEMVFNLPNSQKKFLTATFYNIAAVRYKTWFQIFINLFLIFLILAGFAIFLPTVLITANIIFFSVIASTRYNALKKLHHDYTKGSIVILMNRHGIIWAVPHLSNKKGKSIEYLYTASMNWEEIEKITFYKTHVEIRNVNNSSTYIFTRSKEERSQLKVLVNKYFKNEGSHHKTELFTIGKSDALLQNMICDSVALVQEECNSFHLGDSYIAPIPSVPKNFKWPTNHQLPLTFLAQINCADLKEADTEGLLPQTGILYFFYEMKEMLLNEKGNQGCARVVYSNVPNDQLYFHKESAKMVNPYFLLSQRKLVYAHQTVLPKYNTAKDMDHSIATSNEETYNYAKWKFLRGKNKPVKHEIGSMFGYPEFHTYHELGIENDKDYLLLLQLTLDKNDFLAYLQDKGNHSSKGINTQNFYKQWTELPCQLYFFIPREDLERLDFSNIRFIRRSKSMDLIDIDLTNL